VTRSFRDGTVTFRHEDEIDGHPIGPAWVERAGEEPCSTPGGVLDP
jgi:hypothetical protein